MRALIIGGGIGGLSAALALQKVGIEAVVFEKTPEITEVGAGLTLWSNAILASRRLGVESEIIAAGSVIEKSRSVTPSGELLDQFDFAGLAQKVGAPTVCVHRAELQRILRNAVVAGDADAVQTGRKCINWEEKDGAVSVLFEDGSCELADLLVGADGIHSVVRPMLFGEERPRYAGYFAWRGIAHGVSHLLSIGEALFIIGRGAQAGCFPCGDGRVYWFLTCNGPPGSLPSRDGNRPEILALIEGWQTPLSLFVEATEGDAILRNDIIDRPPRTAWGKGRTTLLGDAIHATTPNLGQGACQAMEDAVFLAHWLSTADSVQTGLRDYESSRKERTKFVIEQSWELGKIFQLSNPIAVWLRNALSRSEYANRHSKKLFERLLDIDLPALDRSDLS
ncbi:MAG TPA: FAD-dependent monooxygenase [Chroococcales cyanobacterium]